MQKLKYSQFISCIANNFIPTIHSVLKALIVKLIPILEVYPNNIVHYAYGVTYNNSNHCFYS